MKINALSLFDGMSCGYIALQKAGFHIEKYYASEIDSHAVGFTSAKHPDIVHLGDVTKVNAKELPKIDLLLAGSPCQGFSFAGKQLAFDDPRSALFFEFVRILKEVREVNPNVFFLLENVRMKKEHEDVISRLLEIQPININSNLVSAQNLERLYWTNIHMGKNGLFGDNICNIPQPKDKGIYLRDVLEKVVDEKYYISKKAMARIVRKGYSQPKFNPEKTGTINTKNNSGQLSIDSGTTLICEGVTNQNGELSATDKSTCIDANYAKGMDNHSQRTMIIQTARGNNPAGEIKPTAGLLCLDPGESQGNRIYHESGKSTCCSASSGGLGSKIGLYAIGAKETRIRRLTPIEVCRLQGVPDEYFLYPEWDDTCSTKYPILLEGAQRYARVSDTQIYKMCGNGWTVDVIVHILSYLKK